MYSLKMIPRSSYILLLFSLLKICNSYNIFVLSPTPSISHQQSISGLARALAEKGHNVTILTANPGLYEPLPNYHEINASIVYEAIEEYQEKSRFLVQTKLTALQIIPRVPDMCANNLRSILKTEAFQEIMKLKNITVDLIIYEGLYPSILGLVKHFNYPPSIMIFSIPKYVPAHSIMGNTVNPSYVSSFVTSFSDKMSFFERIENTFYILYELYVHHYYLYPAHDALARKLFGEDVPPVKELERNVSLILLSGDLSQNYPIPLQPNTVQVGSLHIGTPKPLPLDIKKWMDESEDGVIYFSLGSVMRGTSVPEDKRNAFIRAFQQFPKLRVIWKWESDNDFPGKTRNILLKKWIPQQSILAHPKIRLFITQGGHQSRQEAVHYAVPMLTVPLFWDQEWNARKTEESGSGLTINYEEITYEAVHEKLIKLLSCNSFQRNAEKISLISKDKPMTNTENAVWWVEYVIRHKGAPHLRPAVMDLHWFQYTLIDIIVFLLLILLTLIYFLYCLINKIVRFFTKTSKTKRHKKKD